MKKSLLFTTLVLIQILLIAYLLVNIYVKQKSVVLGTESVNPISKETLTFPNTSRESILKQFYEPNPNQTIVDNPEWLGYSATYTINSDSLNERYDYSFEKPPDTFRILTIGDSHTFGAYVDTPKNYPEQLEDTLKGFDCKNYKKFEVINLGEGGYNVDYVIERYNIRGSKYNPDLIIWLLNSTDIYPNELIGSVVNEIEKDASKSGEVSNLIKKYGVHYAWTIAQEKVLEQYGIDHLTNEFSNRLENFITSTNKDIILFVYNDEPSYLIDALKKLSDSHDNVFYLDNLKYGDLEKLPDGHPTEKDYTKHSEVIFDYLLENTIINCN